jgi:phosphomannomutase
MDVATLDHPVSKCQLSWLLKESKCDLGIYIGTDYYYPEKLCLFFYDEKGNPLTEEEVLELATFELDREYESSEGVLEILDISLYTKYLTDKKLVPELQKRTPIFIDCMFGAATNVSASVLEDYKLNGTLYNKATEPQRFVNYVAYPSRDSLAWHTPKAIHTDESGLYFGIGTHGDSLGVWDLFQKLEISPSGVMMILMYYLAKVKNKTGTVLISKSLSDKVTVVAEKLGLNPEPIDAGTESLAVAIQQKRKRPILLYGDESGRYWFKGDVPEGNPIIALLNVVGACEKSKLTPGGLVDMLSEKYLNRSYIYSQMVLPRGVKSKEELEKDLVNHYVNRITLRSSKTSLLYLDGSAKITISEIIRQNSLVVYVESETEEKTRQISMTIQNFFKESKNEADQTVIDRVNVLKHNM